MQTLSHEQDWQAVAGGFGAYDVGNGIGSGLRSCILTFIQMGSLYTPTL